MEGIDVLEAAPEIGALLIEELPLETAALGGLLPQAEDGAFVGFVFGAAKDGKAASEEVSIAGPLGLVTMGLESAETFCLPAALAEGAEPLVAEVLWSAIPGVETRVDGRAKSDSSTTSSTDG